MISKELKEIIDLSGGHYIIVEDGQPKYVVMNFEEYKNVVSDRKSVQTLTEEELIEKINSDIAAWREKQNAGKESIVDEIDELEDIEYV